MKAIISKLVCVFLLIPLFFSSLYAQDAGKKIIITKQSTDGEGSQVIETTIKTGKAAENFDLEKYMAENEKDGVTVDVTVVEEGEEQENTVIKKKRGITIQKNGENSWSVSSERNSKHGFLGVTENDDDDDDDDKEAGIEVGIVKNSAAEKAGLEDEDRILQLNKTEVNNWKDITSFMSKTQPGDKVSITYERNGKKKTTEAVLGNQNDNKNWNFNYNINTSTKEACLGVYSESSGEGEAKGAEINEFTTESAAREAELKEGDVILRINTTRVKGHQDVWDVIAKFKPQDAVDVTFLRNGQEKTVKVNLKSCKDNNSTIIVNENSENPRKMRTWNWNESDSEKFRDKRIITIRKSEGDAEKNSTPPAPPSSERALKIDSFKAFPSPTSGPMNIEFRAQPVPTVVSLYDLSGKQLYREELNGFSGDYNQQFDLSAYAKGTILIQITQGEKVFVGQIVVN